MRWCPLVFLVSVVFLARFSQGTVYNEFYFTSAPGAWVGGGQTMAINTVSASRYFSQGAYNDAVTLSSSGYSFTFVEPNYGLPTVGYYPTVTRWPFMNNGAGEAFMSPGRGDNTLTGWFNVLQADYDPTSGAVLDLAVNFGQYDEGIASEYNAGSIRYNSTIPVPEPTAAAGLVASLLLLTSRAKARRRTVTI